MVRRYLSICLELWLMVFVYTHFTVEITAAAWHTANTLYTQNDVEIHFRQRLNFSLLFRWCDFLVPFTFYPCFPLSVSFGTCICNLFWYLSCRCMGVWLNIDSKNELHNALHTIPQKAWSNNNCRNVKSIIFDRHINDGLSAAQYLNEKVFFFQYFKMVFLQ